MGALIYCYCLFHGKRHCWLDLNVSQANELITTGKVVLHGRWYWQA